MKTIRETVTISTPIEYDDVETALGNLFTKQLVDKAAKKNTSISGFCRNALACYNYLLDWRQKTLAPITLLSLSILSGVGAAAVSSVTALVGLGLLSLIFLIVSRMTWTLAKKKHYPGKTALMIGRAWQKAFQTSEEQSIRINVISTLAQKLKHEGYKSNHLQDISSFKKLLGDALNGMLDRHARIVLDAERDGKPHVKKSNRKKMGEISKFARVFEIDTDWSCNFKRAQQG